VVKGDRLACSASTMSRRFSAELTPTFPDVATVAVLPGLQTAWFEESTFYARPFTVTPTSNRMGLRLKGNPLTMPDRVMISEPVCPGAVQVTNDGQCIILGVDGQTI